ncbi:pilus assembly protein PilP [Candidatus Pelagibacter sp.]|jgi:hypothetical protein|nr:pilus assembly protein PilP [Candidatus Pelagibacter sp.]MDB3904424.1 pilus assembly protein PilP [Candidatus Pelagibacter sp.]MDC0406941.1 pilus assembly protein PilP [Candidatus Pelagibacter sp.]MDC0922130.1 pilus assembly protein PilP [Candidatus Pelagibacter sp.]|tara:strand:- start:494 stop:1000 length:507 start_codon:yes stop_codon:yes gene_type:complete
MNFFKIIIISVFFMLLSKVSMADSHDNKQDIIEKAKEINKKIKEKQANSQSNISSEINDEEPLPLNDPFAGDSSLTGGNTILSSNPEEAQNEMSLYKFKLVGIMTSANDDGFVSLINSSGNIITLAKFEELSPGVKLVGLNNREAVFEKNENSLLVINFNNKITERTK